MSKPVNPDKAESSQPESSQSEIKERSTCTIADVLRTLGGIYNDQDDLFYNPDFTNYVLKANTNLVVTRAKIIEGLSNPNSLLSISDLEEIIWLEKENYGDLLLNGLISELRHFKHEKELIVQKKTSTQKKE